MFFSLFVLLLVLVATTFVMMPILLSDAHKRAQDIAFLIASLFAFQALFELNFGESRSLRNEVYSRIDEAATLIRKLKREDQVICLNNVTSPTCNILNNIADEPEIIGLFISQSYLSYAKDLGVNPFSRQRLQAEIDAATTQFKKGEAKLPTEVRRGRSGARVVITGEAYNDGLKQDIEFRESLERGLALHLIELGSQAAGLERVTAIWLSVASLPKVAEYLVDASSKERFLKAMGAFFVYIAFAVGLSRIALKPPESSTT